MYKQAYLNLCDQLNTELNTTDNINKFGELQFIAMFNNQFNESAREHVMPKPAILVQFVNSNWSSKPSGQQEGETIVRIHVAMHNLADDNYYAETTEEALKNDEYLDQVHIALHGKSIMGLGTLTRTRSEQDEAHDHIFVYIMEYAALIDDCSADPSNTMVETSVDVNVTAETIVPAVVDSKYRVGKLNDH